MSEGAYPAVAEVLPQAGRMVLLTAIVEHAEDGTSCVVEIGEDDPFREAGGLVPAWVGLEYMAQCVAAHGGLRARETGGPVRIGFVAGSRRLDVLTAGFSPGQVLEVRARLLAGGSRLLTFACSLRDRASGALFMEGDLQVILSDGPGPDP